MTVSELLPEDVNESLLLFTSNDLQFVSALSVSAAANLSTNERGRIR
jgi:hypothetical protein